MHLLHYSLFIVSRETAFNFEVSSVLWPSNINMESTLENVKHKLGYVAPGTEEKRISQNLIKVEIYYQEFNSEMIRERPAYLVIGRLFTSAKEVMFLPSLVSLSISNITLKSCQWIFIKFLG